MSFTHLHLLLNHFPVIGIILITVVTAIAFVRKNNELTKLSLWGIAGLAVVSLFVYLTGEPAEKAVEHLPGFSEAITERHEEAALFATIVMGLIGAISLAALGFFRRREVPRKLIGVTLALSLAGSAVMGYAGFLGGQIRHTEIRSSTAVTASPSED